jgi:aspartate/methionine/tyrosine aminotransferase
LVVSPNNPTGSYLKLEDRDLLADLARQHGLALIADEVFRDYGWEESPAGPSVAQTADCLALTFNGLSKICALPQMKLAWMALSGPGGLVEDALARLEVIADTYLSVNTPVQWAAAHWLSEAGAVQSKVLARVRSNLEFLDELLGGSHSPVTRLRAEGGWYATLRVPTTRSDEDWALGLLQEHGVYVHPGHFFDFPRDGFLVVSLIAEEVEFRTGMEKLAASIA